MFLVWDWVVLVFSFVSFSDIIEVSMLVKGVVVSLIGCWLVFFWMLEHLIVCFSNAGSTMFSTIKYIFK